MQLSQLSCRSKPDVFWRTVNDSLVQIILLKSNNNLVKKFLESERHSLLCVRDRTQAVYALSQFLAEHRLHTHTRLSTHTHTNTQEYQPTCKKDALRAESTGNLTFMPEYPSRSPKPPATSTNAACCAAFAPALQVLSVAVKQFHPRLLIVDLSAPKKAHVSKE